MYNLRLLYNSVAIWFYIMNVGTTCLDYEICYGPDVGGNNGNDMIQYYCMIILQQMHSQSNGNSILRKSPCSWNSQLLSFQL